MDRILIILKKENRSRASSALTLGLNTIILKHVYWYTYMQQISGERLQDHWSSGVGFLVQRLIFFQSFYSKKFSIDEQRVSQMFEEASTRGINVEQR